MSMLQFLHARFMRMGNCYRWYNDMVQSARQERRMLEWCRVRWPLYHLHLKQTGSCTMHQNQDVVSMMYDKKKEKKRKKLSRLYYRESLASVDTKKMFHVVVKSLTHLRRRPLSSGDIDLVVAS